MAKARNKTKKRAWPESERAKKRAKAERLWGNGAQLKLLLDDLGIAGVKKGDQLFTVYELLSEKDPKAFEVIAGAITEALVARQAGPDGPTVSKAINEIDVFRRRRFRKLAEERPTESHSAAENLRAPVEVWHEEAMREESAAPEKHLAIDAAFADASLGDLARNLLEELDATQAPIRDRLVGLLSQLDAARDRSGGSQQELVRRVNVLLLRLGMHLACPTCGRPSVLEYRKPQPSSRYAGGIVAAHVLPGDRSKHAPDSWAGLSASSLVARPHPEP